MAQTNGSAAGAQRIAARAALRDRLRASGRSYPRLVWQTLRATRSWDLTVKILSWNRRARLVRLIVGAVLFLWQIFETGAALLLFLAAALLVLPFLLLLLLGLFPAVLLTDRRVVRALGPRCRGRDVWFFFPANAQLAPGSFLRQNAAALAGAGATVFLVLPPRLTAPDGALFFCCRKTAPRLYVLRYHTYLRLSRALAGADRPRRVIQCF